MPFQRLAYGSNGARVAFASARAGALVNGNIQTQNYAEGVDIVLTPKVGRNLRGIRINTLFTNPGLIQSFVITFLDSKLMEILSLPTNISAQTFNGITNGLIVNVDGSVTAEIFIPLSLVDCQVCRINNVADQNNLCQAIFSFEME